MPTPAETPSATPKPQEETHPTLEPNPTPIFDELLMEPQLEEHIWYIRGYNDNTIRPDAEIKRGEVAMIFFRLLNGKLNNLEPESKFNDVDAEQWYGLGINLLARYGILNGYGDGTFCPERAITRSELAAIVSRFDNLIETKNNPYNDLDPENWAYKYILSATKKGWFIGDNYGSFKPDQNLTRAEFVTVTNRMFNRYTLMKNMPSNVHKFNDLDVEHWAYADFMEAIYTYSFGKKEDDTNKLWLKIIDDGFNAAYNK